MTVRTNHEPAVLDHAHTETALWRVAISAFTYYPGKEWDEPGYTVDEDVNWCLATLAALPIETLDELRASIHRLITDPTANRREFVTTLAGLAADE